MITAGSIVTNSTTEKFFNIFICMVLTVTFSYSMNTIGTILDEMQQD